MSLFSYHASIALSYVHTVDVCGGGQTTCHRRQDANGGSCSATSFVSLFITSALLYLVPYFLMNVTICQMCIFILFI